MAPAAIASLLSLIPSAIQALSQLVSNIRQKRPAGEIVGDAVDTLSDLSGVIGKTLPYDDGHPVREALDLLPMVATVTADGRVTRQEALALGESLARSGADVLAWAQTLPDTEPMVDYADASASLVLARGTAKRRTARMHARPQGQGRKPIHPSALVASKPQPPALPTSWPFGRPLDAVFGDATGRPPLPGGKVPGATLPKPPVDTRPPKIEIDDDTADVPPPIDALPIEPVVDGVEEGPPATEPRPLAGLLRVARMVHFDGLDRPGCDVGALCDAMIERDAALRATGTPELWALTGPQVELLERARPRMLSGLRPGFLAAREPHKGMGSAHDAQAALYRAGVAPSLVLGSAVDPTDYVGDSWSVVVTGAQPGHVRDTKESGFRLVAPGFVSCQSAATASSSQKSKVAREVADGSLLWGFEAMSISAMDPQTGGPHVAADGSRHYFGTPKTEDRDDHPDVASVPAEVAWANMMAGAKGVEHVIYLTTFDEAAAAAVRAGALDATGSALYPSDKS